MPAVIPSSCITFQSLMAPINFKWSNVSPEFSAVPPDSDKKVQAKEGKIWWSTVHCMWMRKGSDYMSPLFRGVWKLNMTWNQLQVEEHVRSSVKSILVFWCEHLRIDHSSAMLHWNLISHSPLDKILKNRKYFPAPGRKSILVISLKTERCWVIIHIQCDNRWECLRQCPA